MKIDHVKIILVLTLLFIFFAPIFFAENIVLPTSIFVALLAIISTVFHKWFDVFLAGIILFGFVILRPLFYQGASESLSVLGMSGFMALTMLGAVLLIGPWSTISHSFRLQFFRHRRHVGVLAFLWGLFHATLILKENLFYDVTLAFSSPLTFFGFIALFVMLLLALTSWNWAQGTYRESRWWSIVHEVTLWIYVIFVWYFSVKSTEDISLWHGIILGTFVLFWFGTAPWSLPRYFLSRVVGWKQLHMLAYVAFASALVHVWLTWGQDAAIALQLIYWIFIVFVVGSYLVAWGMMLRKKINKKSAPK
ncbi:MAG TPA: hypothetical protein VJH89_02890 [Patescibacteria group bacterium]|nr:hypothetical protein [Patescibacteria group bacterium]